MGAEQMEMTLEPPGCWLESRGKAGTGGASGQKEAGITPSPGNPGAPALPTRRPEPMDTLQASDPTARGRLMRLVLSY